MSFVTEKEELKPGLILFRRGDVEHRMWYCRMKMPKADRYKTVSLKTTDREAARERAFDQDADVRFRIKHDVPVFNRPFREVAHEYLLTQEARAKRGEISAARPKKLRAVIEGTLDRYAGSTQVHLIGDERWGSYPAWRRENGAGRHRRNGVREITAATAQTFADHEAERRTKVQQTLGIRVLKPIEVKPSEERVVPFISDSTIRFEMSIFGGVDVYFLAEQMGTSVHMIESHYGHVNTIKHADRVLQGMAGWELPQPDHTTAKASKAAEAYDKSKRGQHRRVG